MRRSGFGVMALGVAAAFFMAGRAGYFLHAGKHFLHAGKSGTAAVSAGFAVIDLLVATVIGVVLLRHITDILERPQTELDERTKEGR